MKLSYLLSRVEKIEICDIFMILFSKFSKVSSKISILFFNPALVLCLGVLAMLGVEDG